MFCTERDPMDNPHDRNARPLQRGSVRYASTVFTASVRRFLVTPIRAILPNSCSRGRFRARSGNCTSPAHAPPLDVLFDAHAHSQMTPVGLLHFVGFGGVHGLRVAVW